MSVRKKTQHQTGQGAESARADRAGGVAGDGGCREALGTASSWIAVYRRAAELDSTACPVQRSNGRRWPTSCATSRPPRASTAPVIAPFTGEVLHDLPLSTVDDVADATAAARVAQAAWWAAGDAHRRRVLLKAHDLLLERREELLDAVQTETGKTRGQAFEEVFNAANATRYNALSARRVLKGGRRRGGIPFVFVPRVRYTPKGVIGVITPWNYPLALAIMDIAPALAAGNGVVQKADNQGAISILTARRAFIDAGLPAALWAVVAGPGGEVGNAVVDAGDYVVFTGSTATGRDGRPRAPPARLVGASMELGGKNAAHRARRRRPGQGGRRRRQRLLHRLGSAVRLDRAHLRA